MMMNSHQLSSLFGSGQAFTTSENTQLKSAYIRFFVSLLAIFSHLYQSDVFVNNTDSLTFLAPGILHFSHGFKDLTLL